MAGSSMAPAFTCRGASAPDAPCACLAGRPAGQGPTRRGATWPGRGWALRWRRPALRTPPAWRLAARQDPVFPPPHDPFLSPTRQPLRPNTRPAAGPAGSQGSEVRLSRGERPCFRDAACAACAAPRRPPRPPRPALGAARQSLRSSRDVPHLTFCGSSVHFCRGFLCQLFFLNFFLNGILRLFCTLKCFSVIFLFCFGHQPFTCHCNAGCKFSHTCTSTSFPNR